MSRISYRLSVVLAQLDEDRFLASSLFNVRYTSIGHYPEQALSKLKTLLETALPNDQSDHYAQNLSAEDATVERLTIAVAAHHENVSWSKSLAIPFPVVRYRKTQPEGRDYWVGFVPWLELSFTSRDAESWEERGESEIKRYLLRIGASRDLQQLVAESQSQEVTLDHLNIELDFPSTLARLKGEQAQKKCPVEGNARRLERDKNALPTFGRDAEIQRIGDALLRTNRCGILLVGPSGVGKSAIVREMIQRQTAKGFARFKFFETNGARLIAGRSGFGEWQEVVNEMIEAAASKNYVLLLGSLFELSNVGQSVSVQQGIAAFLRPHIASGRLAVICECTSEHYLLLEKKEPNLLQAFERIDIDEPDAGQTQAILEAAADFRQKRFGLTITPAARRMLVKLFGRFAAYSAQPGPLMRFLDNLCLETARGEKIEEGHIIERFSQVSGLPPFILDRKLPMSLSETRAFFESAIIGQHRAIGHMVDMLATVKARLTQPGRPICSLLFIGPTGVGKTESAKALAKRLFGDEDRLTRFDMSEYADEIGVRRLLAGDAKEAGLLTALVREQPFSLVVFDEFEKAHPQFFDLLLQILGDARLTDDYGRTARFDNTVIIMTSNLGAERFDRGRIAMVGDSGHKDPAQQHFTHEVRRFLRPEIYNRIDVIVPFHGLSRDDIAAVTQLELAKLKRRAGLSENDLSLTVDEAVVDTLIDKGYDAKLGARALKRAVDQHLALPLAARMARGDLKGIAGFTAEMGPDGVVIGDVPLKTQMKDNAAAGVTVGFLSQIRGLRRQAEAMALSPQIERVRGRLESLNYRLQRHLKAVAKNPKTKPLWDRAELHQQIQLITGQLQNLDRFLNDLREFEDYCQEKWHGFPVEPQPKHGTLPQFKERFLAQLITFYRYQIKEPDHMVLGLFGPKRDLIEKMAGIYVAACFSAGMKVAVTLYFTKEQNPTSAFQKSDVTQPATPAAEGKKSASGEQSKRRSALAERNIFLRRPQADVSVGDEATFARLLAEHPDPIHGLALEIDGPNAGIWFAGESNYHIWDEDENFVRVDGSRKKVVDYTPPEGVVGPPPKIRPVRRNYLTKYGVIQDRDLPQVTIRKIANWSEALTTLHRIWLLETLAEVFEP